MNNNIFKLYQENTETGCIDFEGHLVLQNLEGNIEDIKNHVSKYTNLIVKINNCLSIDLSFIQLLISIKKTLKSTKIQISLPEKIIEILRNSGFSNLERSINSI